MSWAVFEASNQGFIIQRVSANKIDFDISSNRWPVYSLKRIKMTLKIVLKNDCEYLKNILSFKIKQRDLEKGGKFKWWNFDHRYCLVLCGGDLRSIAIRKNCAFNNQIFAIFLHLQKRKPLKDITSSCMISQLTWRFFVHFFLIFSEIAFSLAKRLNCIK